MSLQNVTSLPTFRRQDPTSSLLAYSIVGAVISFCCFVLIIGGRCYVSYQKSIPDAGMGHIIQRSAGGGGIHNSTNIELIYDCEPNCESPSPTDLQNSTSTSSSGSDPSAAIITIQGEEISSDDEISDAPPVSVSIMSLSSSIHYMPYNVVTAIPVTPIFNLNELHSSPPVSARSYLRI